MLDSININNPLILRWSQFLERRFTILKGDPALYHHTRFGPVTYRTVVTKWAKKCLAWGSMLHTFEAIEQFVNVLGKHSCRQLLAAVHPHKKHKNWSSSTLVSLSQFASLKNNFPTRKPVTFE